MHICLGNGNTIQIHELNLTSGFCFKLHVSSESGMSSLLEYGQTYVRETGCIGLLLQLFR